MTIRIGNSPVASKTIEEIISEPNDGDRQIVKAWERSRIEHHFKNRRSFKEAVRKNRKALAFPGKIASLFKASNYLFSTKAQGRKETLYFENAVTKETGRLRQEHSKGPLARIDKRPKRHRFLTTKRLDSLEKWRAQAPRDSAVYFYICEERPRVGKRHVEFAFDGRKITGWHVSNGTVQISRRDIESRVRSATKEILGI